MSGNGSVGMIPTATLVAFWIAFVLTAIAPIALIGALLAKRKVSPLPLVLGVAAFFVSQILIRLPLMQLFATQPWYQQFSLRWWPFIIVNALSAGLFEESARLGGAQILKTQRSFKDIISFGLGHGLCEAFFIVGMTHLNNLLFSYVINHGANEDALATLFPGETLATVTNQLVTAGLGSIYAGIFERLAAVLFHIFATFLIFHGVIKHQKLRYFLLAVAAHAAFNIIAVVIFQVTGPFITVATLLLLASLATYLVWRQRTNPLLAAS